MLEGSWGVYLIPYTTRFRELQFLEKKEIDCFRHSLSTHFEYCWNNVNSLNFKYFLDGGTRNSWGRRNYLGAMTQARHCVTLRWPLAHVGYTRNPPSVRSRSYSACRVQGFRTTEPPRCCRNKKTAKSKTLPLLLTAVV